MPYCLSISSANFDEGERAFSLPVPYNTQKSYQFIYQFPIISHSSFPPPPRQHPPIWHIPYSPHRLPQPFAVRQYHPHHKHPRRTRHCKSPINPEPATHHALRAPVQRRHRKQRREEGRRQKRHRHDRNRLHGRAVPLRRFGELERRAGQGDRRRRVLLCGFGEGDAGLRELEGDGGEAEVGGCVVVGG